MSSRFVEFKKVARGRNFYDLTHSQLLVQVPGASATVLIVKHCDHISIFIAGICQRVASDQSVAQVKVNVCTGFSGGKDDVWSCRPQLDTDNVFSFKPDVEDECLQIGG